MTESIVSGENRLEPIDGALIKAASGSARPAAILNSLLQITANLCEWAVIMARHCFGPGPWVADPYPMGCRYRCLFRTTIRVLVATECDKHQRR